MMAELESLPRAHSVVDNILFCYSLAERRFVLFFVLREYLSLWFRLYVGFFEF